MLATLLLRQRGALGQAGWLLRAPRGRRGTCPSPSRGKPHGEWPAVGTDLHTLLHPYSRRALFNVPTMHLPQLFTSTLPGTHRRTHSCPRRTERHRELLTSVDGVCPGSFCSPQHLTSSDRTAWYFLCSSAARAAVSCLTVLLRGPSCCAPR